QIQATNKLKQLLTEEPLLLRYPHPTAPFILATGASEYAIGGALKQIVDGKTHYNYFLSRLLTTTERNYKTIEREALAIFWCMKKLEQYLGGRDVVIHTDHKPLAQFHKKNKFNSKRIDEWLLKHQDMLPQMVDVTYKKGNTHGDADGMSRPEIHPHPHYLNAITRSMTTTAVHKPVINHDSQSTVPLDNTDMAPASMTFDFSLTRIRDERQHNSHIVQQRTAKDRDPVLFKFHHRK
ncbi:unnamed protein product, partial [Didymodactylos carnosus]